MHLFGQKYPFLFFIGALHLLQIGILDAVVFSLVEAADVAFTGVADVVLVLVVTFFFFNIIEFLTWSSLNMSKSGCPISIMIKPAHAFR